MCYISQIYCKFCRCYFGFSTCIVNNVIVIQSFYSVYTTLPAVIIAYIICMLIIIFQSTVSSHCYRYIIFKFFITVCQPFNIFYYIIIQVWTAIFMCYISQIYCKFCRCYFGFSTCIVNNVIVIQSFYSVYTTLPAVIIAYIICMLIIIFQSTVSSHCYRYIIFKFFITVCQPFNIFYYIIIQVWTAIFMCYISQIYCKFCRCYFGFSACIANNIIIIQSFYSVHAALPIIITAYIICMLITIFQSTIVCHYYI